MLLARIRETLSQIELRSYLEIVVIDGEIFLHDGSLLLGSTRRWRNKIFRIVVIIHPLEPTGAQGSQESRNYEKVAGMFTDCYTKLEEQFLQSVVHNLQTELARHVCSKSVEKAESHYSQLSVIITSLMSQH